MGRQTARTWPANRCRSREHESPAARHDRRADTKDFYHARSSHAGNRIGFIYQKLKEPRSYDFEKTENKRYNERLRMPQFPFTREEREAVITFVLGLVADPPREKYVYHAQTPRRSADRRAGRCWRSTTAAAATFWTSRSGRSAIRPDDFGPQVPQAKIFPFLRPQFSPQESGRSRRRPTSAICCIATLVRPAEARSKERRLADVADLDGAGRSTTSQLYAVDEISLAIDLCQAHDHRRQPVSHRPVSRFDAASRELDDRAIRPGAAC